MAERDPYGSIDKPLKKRTDPRAVTRADHDKVQQRIWPGGNPVGTEDYAITIAKAKGYWVKSVHVFERNPSQSEINIYEQTASRVKFKGQNAQIEGSQIEAAVGLYNRLISRAYDVQNGMRFFETLDREQAKQSVPALLKREAIRELISEVYSASRMNESLGDEDEDGPEADDEGDEDEHTSKTSPD